MCGALGDVGGGGVKAEGAWMGWESRSRKPCLWGYMNNGKENGNYYTILGLYRDNGKENGNYYTILGLYRDNGKENGNYYMQECREAR